MITADQLKDVMERTEALHHYLNIDKKRVEFEEEQLRTQAPDFWEDPKYAQEQMKKVKGIQKWLDGYKTVRLYADEESEDAREIDKGIRERKASCRRTAARLRLPQGRTRHGRGGRRRLRQGGERHRRPRAYEYAPTEGGPDGLRHEDQLRCRRHGEPGLGADAYAYVYALGRSSWL